MSGFEQSQQNYYLRQINRAIPVTSRAADLGTIQAALGVVDPAMPEDTTAMTDAVQFMSTFGRKTDAITRDAECRALPMPGEAMRPDAGARKGCGWWFVPDAGAPSVGAYGTRRGPMNPRMDEQFGAGQWLWDPREAQRREDLKRAARVTDCASMASSSIANRLGWCPETGMAVVVDADGNPRYPTAAGGDCPSTPLRTCPSTPSNGGGGAGGGGGGGGTGGGCSSNPGGPMSPACIQQYITRPVDETKYSACSTNGLLYQSLNGTYATDSTFSGLNYYLQQGGLSTPGGITSSSAITADDIGMYTTALARASADPTSRVGRVATTFCYGGTVPDPCAPPMLAPSDKDYPMDCVTRQALAMHYSADGTIMPSQVGNSYWRSQGGGTWQGALDTLSRWKQIADNPSPADLNRQADAIMKVYGVSVKYPRTGCNNTGMYIYRYYYNTADPATVFNGTAGPHTHFLGRYIVKQTDTFWNTPLSSMPIMPAGGTAVEAQRYVTIFRPSTGGSYQFMITFGDYMRFGLYDSNGSPIITPTWQSIAGTVTLPSVPVTIVADQEYTLIIDTMANSGSWAMNIQTIVNSQGGSQINGNELYLPYDRRMPMFELAFNAMPVGTGTRDATSLQQVSDTNGVFQNLAFMGNANIGTLGGKTCMLVNNGGIYNFNRFSQGFRAHAFKSMTCMINVTSYQNSTDGKTAPSLISFYNVAGRDPATPVLQAGSPPTSWAYGNRAQDMSIFMFTGAVAFQYKDTRDPSILTQYFYNSVPFTTGQWHHIAIVWDDDFQGYAFFLDGTLKGQLRATGPGVSQMFEQMRIGSDVTGDGSGWQGGIAWFRAFDYRLSTDQIQTDMNDNWESLS